MEFLEWLRQLASWMQNFAITYGYVGIFFIAFLGACSIIVPVPYTLVIFTLGGISDFNPVLVAFSAGLGSAVGEFSGYALGYYGQKAISPERRRKMDFMVKFFNHYGPVVVFLFALTPLPDDLLFIPLGILRYSFFRIFVPVFVGKVLMNFILFYSGKLSIGIIRDLFGENDLIWMPLTAVLLVIIVLVLLKIDWEKVLGKYVNVSQNGKEIQIE
ncbi:MAG: VTT domain-containing protein [Candidatus Bathyarchaeia archaeon]